MARVTGVRHDPDDPFTVVTAEPTARLDRSREVLLVWTLSPESPGGASGEALGDASAGAGASGSGGPDGEER